MSGTYAGAYSDKKYSSPYIPEEKTQKIYTVMSAKHIDTYHYHGSWFEYAWELSLVDSQGNKVKSTMDTWDEHKQLTGKQIEYDGNVFRLLKVN